jgi:conjugal transfer pilus assembly protein TraV
MSDPRRGTTILVCALLAVLGGCAANLSGLDGASAYACKAPVGSQCTSVSGVYANSLGGQFAAFAPPAPAREASRTPDALAIPAFDTLLPSNEASAAPGGMPTSEPPTTAATLGIALQPGRSPAPLRSPPRVLRLWIAPWEDADGDLHEASVVHVLVDAGRWLIERVIPSDRAGFVPVRPPDTVHAAAPGAAESEVPPPSLADPDRFPPYPQEFREEDAGSTER